MSDSNKNARDIHVQIESMFHNMDKLFSSLGVEEKSRPVYSSQLQYILETMVNKGPVYSNIEVLNRKLQDAVKKSEEVRIRQWAANAPPDESSSRELEQVQIDLRKMKEQNADLLQAMEAERKKTEALSQRLKTAEDALALQEKKNKQRNLDQIKLLIAFRDSILMKEDLAKDQGQPTITAIFSALSKETANLLEKCGVTVLDKKGHYDGSMHYVTETRPTDDGMLQDEIAEVFRPGYILGDEMVRPEEVILYTNKR